MKPEIFTSVHALRGAYGDAPWCTPRQTLDLVATVEHHMARADAAEQECARLRARVAAVESALRHRVARCEDCDAIATRRGVFDSSPFYHDLCDTCAKACGESVEEPHAEVLRSLDAPALTIDAAACDAIDGSNAGPQHVDATGREVLP